MSTLASKIKRVDKTVKIMAVAGSLVCFNLLFHFFYFTETVSPNGYALICFALGLFITGVMFINLSETFKGVAIVFKYLIKTPDQNLKNLVEAGVKADDLKVIVSNYLKLCLILCSDLILICGIGSFAFAPNIYIQIADSLLSFAGFISLLVGYSVYLERKVFDLPADYKIDFESDSFKKLLEWFK